MDVPYARGLDTNHLHKFMDERNAAGSASGFLGMADAKAKFSELCNEEQQRFRDKAAAERRLAREKPSRLDALLESAVSQEFIGGPLGIAGDGDFPMSVDALSSHMGERSLKATRKEWSQRQQFQSSVSPALDFPERLEVNDVCVGGCSCDFKDRTGAWKEEFVELSIFQIGSQALAIGRWFSFLVVAV